MRSEKIINTIRQRVAALACAIMMALASPFNIFSETPSPEPVSEPAHRPVKPVRPVRPAVPASELPDSIPLSAAEGMDATALVVDSIYAATDSLAVFPVDTIAIVKAPGLSADGQKVFTFNPDPTRAVWMSALFPGLGQLYNRRYWKLPIVVGAFMGLGYATQWNTTMLRDYTTAYGDIMDNDPTTKSYMDFFAPTVKEEDLDRTWLTNILRTRKNYYRRNRDLCILCMVGVYLVAMVDAYVDAQLAHFDISPNLSVDVAPALMDGGVRSLSSKPSVGLCWAINF